MLPAMDKSTDTHPRKDMLQLHGKQLLPSAASLGPALLPEDIWDLANHGEFPDAPSRSPDQADQQWG